MVIFLVTYSIYNLNDNYYLTTDSLPVNFNAVNYVNTGKIDLTDFKNILLKGDLIGITTENQYSKKIYTKQPFLSTIAAVPYFNIYNKFEKLNNTTPENLYEQRDVYQIIGKKFASLLTAIASSILFLSLVTYFRQTFLSLIGTLTYAFATFSWATVSQANATHHTSALLIAIGFLLAVHLFNTKKIILAVLLGIIFAMSYTLRSCNFIFFIGIVMALIIGKYQKKIIFSYFSSGIFYLFINQLFLKINQIPNGFTNEISYSISKFNLVYSLKVAATLLLSPNRGLLIFYPIFIFSFIGIFIYLKNKRNQEIMTFSLISILGIFGLNTIWWAWWGGYCWGPRLLTELSIPAIYFIVFFLTKIKINRLSTIIYALLFFYSAIINIIGIYINDLNWDANYLHSGDFNSVWDIKNPAITYYLKRRVLLTKKLKITPNKFTINTKVYLFLPRELSFVKTLDADQDFPRILSH